MLFYLGSNDFLKRKGQKSGVAHPPIKANVTSDSKGASYVTSRLSGSLTVEASLVLPIFIGAVILLIFIIQAMQIQVQIQKALFNQTMKVTGYGYYVDSVNMAAEAENFLEVGYIKLRVLEELGNNFFENGCVVNGRQGFVLNLSNISEEGIVDVVLHYSLKPPIDILGIGKLNFVARARCAIWTGQEYAATEWDTSMVYMTAKGEVYHCDKNCTYIQSDISYCRFGEIDDVRNASGARYYPCALCGNKSSNSVTNVYYTQYGTRYHIKEFCTNLKSNVFAIEADAAKEKYRSCSKCGQKKEDND